MQDFNNEQEELVLYGESFSSRMLLGTALYPSPKILCDAISAARCDIVTVSLRRQDPHSSAQNDSDGYYEDSNKERSGGQSFWQIIRDTGCKFLPNTAGCHSVQEAITTAEMSRELFETPWLKLEVIGDDYNLQPDPFGLLEAAKLLIERGFKVLPYATDDLVLCQRLRDVGCEVLMPWGAPIGTGQGLMNKVNLETLRNRLPDIPLIIDAGIGAPSQACEAMEMGFDAILLNTAVAKAQEPPRMAKAFAEAIQAGRGAFEAGLMLKRQTASPSTPTIGQPFWHQK